MKILEVFDIFKNPSKNCLNRSNKNLISFSRKLLTKVISCNKITRFAKKQFDLYRSKISKKEKNTIFKGSEHLFLTSKPCFKMLRMTFDSKSFESFVLLSLEMLPTSSIKKIQKPKTEHLQTHRKFVFHFKIASKPFSTMLHLTKRLIEKVFKALSCCPRRLFLHHSEIW